MKSAIAAVGALFGAISKSPAFTISIVALLALCVIAVGAVLIPVVLRSAQVTAWYFTFCLMLMATIIFVVIRGRGD